MTNQPIALTPDRLFKIIDQGDAIATQISKVIEDLQLEDLVPNFDEGDDAAFDDLTALEMGVLNLIIDRIRYSI